MVNEEIKEVTMLIATAVALHCPHCDMEQDGFVGNPDGNIFECDECGRPYKVICASNSGQYAEHYYWSRSLQSPPKPLPLDKISKIELFMCMGFLVSAILAVVVAQYWIGKYAIYVLFGGVAACFFIGAHYSEMAYKDSV